MKRTLSMLLCALLAMATSVQAQNTIDKQGRRQGHWLKTDKDGSKIYEGTFANGLETGTFTYYYHDGTVRMRNTYFVDGERCSHQAYDEKGRLIATGFYTKHNRDSVWNFYNEQGSLIKTTTYRMGIKNGPSIIFTSKGDTAEVTYWLNNHRHGRWWKRIGSKGYITGNYVRGGLEGRLEEYDDSARLVRSGNYRNGLKHGPYLYYENNTLTIDEEWTDGRMADRKVLIVTPKHQYISIYDIVCLAPNGKNKVAIYLHDGSKIIDLEPADNLYARVGNELFVTANRKNRVLVALRSVEGFNKDAEGREALKLSTPVDFAIFPDEDCEKMVRSRQYENDSPLDKEQ